MACRAAAASGRHPARAEADGQEAEPLHETTVRFTDEVWAKVRATSKREGSSAAQFVRDATVAQLATNESVEMLRRDFERSMHNLDVRVQRLEALLRRHGLYR